MGSLLVVCYRKAFSAIPSYAAIWDFGCLNVKRWGATPPPPRTRTWGAIPPPLARGVSQQYLGGTSWKQGKWNGYDTSPLRTDYTNTFSEHELWGLAKGVGRRGFPWLVLTYCENNSEGIGANRNKLGIPLNKKRKSEQIGRKSGIRNKSGWPPCADPKPGALRIAQMCASVAVTLPCSAPLNEGRVTCSMSPCLRCCTTTFKSVVRCPFDTEELAET